MLPVGTILGRTEKIVTKLYFYVCDSNKDPQMRKSAGWGCGVVGEVHALLCKEMEFGIDRRGEFCE